MSTQYRKKITRLRGSEDMDWADKQRAKKAVARVYPKELIKINNYITADLQGKYIVKDHLTVEDLDNYGLITRHPDVLVEIDDKVLLIVEIDGKVHKGDTKRDRDYEILGIPLVKIVKAEWPDNDWDDYLYQQIRRILGMPRGDT